MKILLKVFLWFIGIFSFISISLSLLLLIPAVQRTVVNKVTNYVSMKTNMKSSIASVHIGFPKTIKVGGIFIEDQQQDTLLYCKEISISAALLPLIRKKVQVDYMKINGLHAHIFQDKDSTYNFTPILEAFSTTNDSTFKTTGKPWLISLVELDLMDINADYTSRIDSGAYSLNLGKLGILAKSIDISTSKFDLKKIDIENTSISMKMANNSANPVSPEKPAPIPIDLGLDELTIENFHFDLHTNNGDFDLVANLKKANLLPSKIDLPNFTIDLEELQADGVMVALKLLPADTVENPSKIQGVNTTIQMPSQHTFGDFPWRFSIQQAGITNTSYTMDLNQNQRLAKGMDYEHMVLSDISFTADDLFFNQDSTGFQTHSFTVKDVSGPEVKQISGKFFMDNTHISADTIQMETRNSMLEGSVVLGYPALLQIGNDLGLLEIKSTLKGKIETSEIIPFYNFYEVFPSVEKIKAFEIQNFVSNGFLKDFTIQHIAVSLEDSIHLDGNVHITGLPESIRKLDYALDTLWTSGTFLAGIFPDSILPASMHIPKTIGFKSTGKTDFSTGNMSTEITSSFGNIQANAALADKKISAKINLPCFNIGKFIGNEMFSEISLESTFDVKIADSSIGEFNSTTQVHSVDFNHNLIQNTSISLNRIAETYQLQSIFSDSLLTGTINGTGQMIDSTSHFSTQIDLKHADLQALKLVKNELVVAGKVSFDTDFISADNFSGTYKINDLSLIQVSEAYHIGEIALIADIKNDYTNFNLTSDILVASLTGNTHLVELKKAFINHLGHYLSLPDSLLSEKEYNFQFDLKLKKPEFFTTFLLKDLHEFKLEQFHAKYDQRNDLFEADIIIPKIRYGNLSSDDMAFHVNSKTDSTISSLQFGQISYDSIFIKNINLKTKFEEQFANLSLRIHDGSDSLKYMLGAEVSYKDSTYFIVLDSKQTIIDYTPWTIDPNNSLQIKSSNIKASRAQLTYQDQKIGMETTNNILRLNFENFRVQNISGLLEKAIEDRLIKGRVNGYLEVTDLLGNFFLNSNISVKNILLRDEPLGELNTTIQYHKDANLNFRFDLKNDVNAFDAQGEYHNTENGPYVNLVLESNIKKAEVLQPLVEDYLIGLKGGLNGRISIFGNPGKPTINGNMDVTDLDLTIKSFNTRLLNNGKITIDRNLLEFKDFIVKDSLNNRIAVAGTIDASDITSPIYNLKISTKDFMAINSYPEYNKIIQGKLLIGADIDISGKQEKLLIKSSISINKGTDIMYIMPGKELELITDKGIVDFVAFDQLDIETGDVATKQFIGDSIVSMIKGVDLTVQLKIDPAANFSVFIDPNSGDITTFSLKGNLQYKYNDIQRGYLTGLVELEKGFYDLSFYGLVKKKFVYDKGSRVSWSGDVMSGQINFSARYIVKTNSVGLVSNEISSNEKAMYNQRLPYEVILNVTDEISNPSISFGIDLPPGDKSSNPILDTKLKILNMPNMEAERNKQVFALLVGGTFIPDNPGSEGGSDRNFATTAAVNSVNSIMTQQLNNVTGQYIKVVNLDLGLNTFDDYSSGKSQTKTQLDVKVSKELFNDRVSAEVESHINVDGSNNQPGQQNTSGMPEFAVSYKITESGRYRIKAFRENAYDLFDGDIQNSGLAFIFVMEFDSFRKKELNPSADSANETQGEDDKKKK